MFDEVNAQIAILTAATNYFSSRCYKISPDFGLFKRKPATHTILFRLLGVLHTLARAKNALSARSCLTVALYIEGGQHMTETQCCATIERIVINNPGITTLIMEAACTCETSVNFYKATGSNIPESCHLISLLTMYLCAPNHLFHVTIICSTNKVILISRGQPFLLI